MELKFNNRNILVLGSSSGIGYQVAKELALAGANVCLVGRDLSKLKLAYSKIIEQAKENHRHMYVCCDLMQADAPELIWESICSNWVDGVDSLVLNAGGPPFKKHIADVETNEWLQYFQSLFLSQINLVNKCIPLMKQKNFGRIVSITSAGVIEPLQGLVISNSIRSALSGWLKTLSFEVAKFGININSVVIGKVATTRIDKLDEVRANNSGESLEQVKQNSYAQIPIGRYGTVEEAANTILFLLSSLASYINGSHIYIDGGYIKKCF